MGHKSCIRALMGREAIIEKTLSARTLDFMWGQGKNIKKSTAQIMKEIDEGEIDE